jgi:phosphate/sulfate permease
VITFTCEQDITTHTLVGGYAGINIAAEGYTGKAL